MGAVGGKEGVKDMEGINFFAGPCRNHWCWAGVCVYIPVGGLATGDSGSWLKGCWGAWGWPE